MELLKPHDYILGKKSLLKSPLQNDCKIKID